MTNTEGFTGSSVVENLPANAGDTGLIPCLGRSNMPPQDFLWNLSLCAASTEALTPGACVPQQEKPLQQGAQAPPLVNGVPSPHLEKAHTRQRRPSPAPATS